MNSNPAKYKHPYLTAFTVGFLMYAVCVIPFIIYHGGYFFYYGDYNVQQVPFLILCHRAVRSGQFLWSPYIDLGGSMSGCFAFYFWFSPFFWITIPFPESVLPYMMPFLMMAKYGTATLFSYMWIRSFVKTDRAALFGAVLYAFSGFQACNIVFQHFHDVVAFFPLYLITFDRFIQKKKKLGFTFMSAFMLMLNYYFFVGEVVFFVIYYIIRYAWSRAYSNSAEMPPESLMESRRERRRRIPHEIFGLLCFGTLGVGIAAFYIALVYDSILGNPRVNNPIEGYDILYYGAAGTPLAILKSMFTVPDIIAKGTLFSSGFIKSGSVSMYVPCFGLGGAVAYADMRRYRSDWKKRTLAFLIICAFVPVLNSLFSALNWAYYARWFYQPILIASLMTAVSLEDARPESWKKGFLFETVGLGFFALCGILPDQTDDGSWLMLADSAEPRLFWTEILATAIAIPCLYFIVLYQKQTYKATRRALLIGCLACCITTMGVMLNGTSLIARSGGEKWKMQCLESKPALPDMATYSRVETDGTSTNYEMVWGYPTIHCFCSTVTPSIIDFYESLGIKRSVSSVVPYERLGVRQILSMRYAIENDIISSDEKYSSKGGLAGYEQIMKNGDEGSHGYNVYENQYFIPAGFTFDYYMSESEYESLDVESTLADRLLVHTLILPDDIAEEMQYGNGQTEVSSVAGLQHLDPEGLSVMTIEELEQESLRRAATSCSSFAYDNGGFTATTSDLPEENLVFFSCPYASGFTAYVDGEKADIIKCDYGFMAVRVPAGVHDISFRYMPKGLLPACAVSAVCLLIAAGIAVRGRKKKSLIGKA